MIRIPFFLSIAILVVCAPLSGFSQDNPWRVRAWAELGFLSVLDHKIQFSREGTYFDYDEDGGQDVLFPFTRLSVDLLYGPRHGVVFLYQPLALESEVLLERDLRVDGLVFSAGTPMRLFYGFPFWRLSYLYDFWEADASELSMGVTLQIRNATIDFASLDGESLRTNRDVGPVPAFKFRWHQPLNALLWVGAEADGIYAPVSYLNGSDNEVTGAILDASLRAGVSPREDVRIFLNLRYLGGGAEGESDSDGPGDGYNRNWLHFATTSLGASLSF